MAAPGVSERVSRSQPAMSGTVPVSGPTEARRMIGRLVSWAASALRVHAAVQYAKAVNMTRVSTMSTG